MEYSLRQQGYRSLKQPLIRVRVLHGNKAVNVGAKGSFVVRTWDTDNAKSAYYSASPVIVKAEKGQLYLLDLKGNRLEQKLRKVVVHSEIKSWLFLNQEKFRGVFEFYPEKGDTFYTVNVLHLEDYLKGVLQPEIGNRTEEEYEAVKAQAVAARSYALITKEKYPDKRYDLINDINDQVYVGVDGEKLNTNQAIKQTRGEVLSFEGHLIDAYYHSTCAGRTDNIEEIWEKEARPYLKGVEDDTFCVWSKFYTWTEEFTVSEFFDHLRAYIKSIGGEPNKIGTALLNLEIIDRTAGNRAKTLKITTDHGTITLTKDQIRWAIGRHAKPGILPSTNFDFQFTRNENRETTGIIITGHGSGHGIGMCQCGAIGRARAGFDYRSILTHYYTGVVIEKLY